MKYTCIAIDDEFPATQVIKAFVEKVAELELLESFTNAEEAILYLQQNEVDILFLDIQMPQINGLDLAKSLRKDYQIIFTTAYDNYALEGFNLKAIDYLLKPFSFDRFLQAVNKAFNQLDLIRKANQPSKIVDEHISVKADYKWHKIALKDIDYIEGLKAYVSIFVNGKRVIVLESLKNLEEQLPSSKFMRVHKSYIVPLDKVRQLDGNMLLLEEKSVPVGKSYKDIVLREVFDQK